MSQRMRVRDTCVRYYGGEERVRQFVDFEVKLTLISILLQTKFCIAVNLANSGTGKSIALWQS
jgi:hypothetical protein